MNRACPSWLPGALLLLLAAPGAAGPPPPPEPLPATAESPKPSTPGDEEAELAALLSVLGEETEIATKTRMNRDFVPGIVTVLEGDELEELGIENVWEALGLVPGVQPILTQGTTPNLVVRGIFFPFNSGNVRVMLDGVPLTRQSTGLNSSLLYLPTAQVERIEVIRGPGSVIYGDFAFMGLVNIVTRKSGQRVHAFADDVDARELGARVSGGRVDGPWQASVSASGWRSDDVEAPAGRSGEERRDFEVANVRIGRVSVLAERLRRDSTDTTPAGRPGPSLNFEETSWAVEGRYERELVPELHTTLRLAALESDLLGVPSDYSDRVTRAGVDATWGGWAHQSWLATVDYEDLDIRSAAFTLPPAGPGPPPVIRIGSVGRRVAALALQDTVELGPRWQLTAGARYDDHSDLGSRTTPRLSLVWLASERHIFKAQYAEGFRAPTFFEQFVGRNPNLEFERIATSELDYILRLPRAVGRATLFRSRLTDMIFPDFAINRFANRKRASSDGVELEWSQQLPAHLELTANLSYADTVDTRGLRDFEHESEATANWLSDVALLWRPLRRTTLSLRWNHVGDRSSYPGSDAYDLVDLAWTWRNVGVAGLTLRAAARNLLDDPAVYVVVDPLGNVSATELGERRFTVALSWSRP